MSDKIDKLKELKQLLDDGSINENEYNKMKAELLEENSGEKNKSSDSVKEKRKGISWPEVLGVMILPPWGGVIYLFTKQGLIKKLIVLILSFIMSGIYSSIIVKVFRVSPDAENLELIINNNVFEIN